MIIREEVPEDIKEIHHLNELAFGAPEEANIIDKLRDTCAGLLSLVAVDKGKIVGHILFSPATIEGEHGLIKGMGLAPMAVLPERQRQGIGSQLVKEGIESLRTTDCPFIIVLGHPDFYPRFGFKIASKYGIKSQWDGVPDEAFMILWLDKLMMNQVSGVGRYKDEFTEAM
jgi:putative acetyltransferase